MENKQVKVTNMVNGRVRIDVPDLRLKRIWERKGAVKPIELDVLKQAIYDPGVEYMFKEGMLFIDDMDVKIELGLEPEGAKEAKNIIILDDNQKKRYLTVAPLHELKAILKKLSHEQRQELAQYAIEHEITDYERSQILKEATQINVLSAIELNRKAKEG